MIRKALTMPLKELADKHYNKARIYRLFMLRDLKFVSECITPYLTFSNNQQQIKDCLNRYITYIASDLVFYILRHNKFGVQGITRTISCGRRECAIHYTDDFISNANNKYIINNFVSRYNNYFDILWEADKKRVVVKVKNKLRNSILKALVADIDYLTKNYIRGTLTVYAKNYSVSNNFVETMIRTYGDSKNIYRLYMFCVYIRYKYLNPEIDNYVSPYTGKLLRDYVSGSNISRKAYCTVFKRINNGWCADTWCFSVVEGVAKNFLTDNKADPNLKMFLK